MTTSDVQAAAEAVAQIGGGLYAIAVSLGMFLRALGLGDSAVARALNTVALDIGKLLPKKEAAQ